MDNPFTIELLVMDGPLDPTLRTEITSSDIDVKQIMMLMLRNVKPSLKAPTVLSTSQIGYSENLALYCTQQTTDSIADTKWKSCFILYQSSAAIRH